MASAHHLGAEVFLCLAGGPAFRVGLSLAAGAGMGPGVPRTREEVRVNIRRGSIIGAAGVVALLAAACGGGSGVTQQPTPAIPTAAAAPMPTPTAAAIPTAAPTAAVPEGFPFTVVDSNGGEVVFDEPPERIAALDGAVVETLFAIGEGWRIAATHAFVDYPPEVENIPRVGDAFNISIEQVTALDPDLVVIFFDHFKADLERAGLKVLYLKSVSDDFEQTADSIRTWGRITGNVEGAEAEAARFEAVVEETREKMESITDTTRVFQDTGGFWTPGPDTLMGEVFELLNLENIAGDISGYAQISPEVVVAEDPEVVITGEPDVFISNPAFGEVSAVKNGRVFSLPDDALSTAGPRFVGGIVDLARLVYPDLPE